MILSSLNSGCGSDPVSEPEFVPVIYVPDAEGKCEFTNAQDKDDVITPESNKWPFMYVAPLYDLERVKEKFRRCKEWQ